jgi:autotransporter strand-loop-strand O-heptosyltransferase
MKSRSENRLKEINSNWKVCIKNQTESINNLKMNSQEFVNKIISEVNSTEIKDNEIPETITYTYHQIGRPVIEIQGNSKKDFGVVFEREDGSIEYQTVLKTNMWSRIKKEYFQNFTIKISNNGIIINTIKTELKDKRVYISLESKSLGDTLAWIPYVEEFRKKHECKIIISTFMNDLFKEQYPNFEFVSPGERVDNIFGMYKIGWFYDENGDVDYEKVPNDFRKQPLQKTASDILGLEYKEIRPKLKLKQEVKEQKKVGIAIHGTAQSKYWNNPNGWQEVVDYLKKEGYEVVLYSKEHDGYMNNFHPKGIKKFPEGSIQDVIYDMQTCEYFIGIGSGLSWLAWSVGLPVILISGFSEEYTETNSNTFRVINKNVCNGCFNSHKLNPSDWNWCPVNAGTEKQFECTKSISSKDVIGKIQLMDFDWGFFNEDPDFKRIVEKEIFEERIYEKFFKVEEGDVVLDLGSSVGPFAKSILNYKPKKVYCIEPSSNEFPTLVKNVESENVICINKAISNNDLSNVENVEVYGADKTIDNITFKKLISDYNIDKIDFIKTDCEGGEYDVGVSKKS